MKRNTSNMASAIGKKDRDEKKTCNVQVIVRCRPKNSIEQSSPTVINTESYTREVHVNQNLHGKNFRKTFTFDQVHGPATTQEELFKTTASPIVKEVLSGYNCTIFAYGQTSTGKTFTMEGDRDVTSGRIVPHKAGVIPRCVHHIFSKLEETSCEYTVKMSCLELYNEELTDLLNTSSERQQLRIYDNTSKGTVISNIEEIVVTDTSHFMNVLDEAAKLRQKAETQLNKSSSRSHAITTITIHMRENGSDGEDLIKTGKLNLVDLAGSENIGRSGAVDKRAKEAGMINQSLLTLGRVITSLTENCPHVPYRESKLTRILQDSLGGRTKTCVIATISPSASNIEETMSTLEYAHRAKNIRNRPEVNQKMSKRTLIKEMSGDIEKLKMELQAAREKSGVFLPSAVYEEQTNELEQQKTRITELESLVELKQKEMDELSSLFKTKDKELDTEKNKHQETRQELEDTGYRLEDTRYKLNDSRRDLNFTKYVLSEQRRSHRDLYSQADSMVYSLRDSVDDISSLHDKIDRKSHVEQNNKSASTQFYDEMSSHLSSAEEGLEQFSNQQQDAYKKYHQAILSFMERQDAENAKMKDQLSNLPRNMNEMQDQFANILTEFTEERHQDSWDVNTKTQRMENRLEDLFQRLKHSFYNNVYQTQQVLEQKQQQMDAMKQMMSSILSQNLEHSRSFVREQYSSLDCLQNMMRDASQRQINILDGHENRISLFARQQQENNKQFTHDLLGQIQSLLHSHEEKQTTQLEQMTGEMRNEVEEGIGQVKSSENEMSSFLQSFKGDIDQYNDRIISSKEENDTNVSQKMDNLSSLNQDTQNWVSELDNGFDSSIVAIGTEIDETTSDLKNQAQQGISSCDQFEKRSSSMMKNITHRMNEQSHQLVDNVENMNISTRQFTDELDSEARQQRDDSSRFISDQSQTTHHMRCGLHNYVHTLQDDVPTGETPDKKKERHVPDQLPQAPSEEHLLQEFEVNCPDSFLTPDTAEKKAQRRMTRIPDSPPSPSNSQRKIVVDFDTPNTLIEDKENMPPVAL
eukprot:gb/GECH01000443.1/.p1 GENE.gb/GECH01000443.1/~~gb/GECH01000443.1/.p1  ORF type:complete len:1037 (+),score=300.24 gb/GECH01000443.1/:1-3111(+)